MIQRKQSIYLALVILIAALLFIPSIAPFAFVSSATSKEFDITLTLTGISTRCVSIKQSPSYIGLIVLNSLIIITSLYTLLMFNKRKLQIKLCYINAAFVLLLLGGMWLFTDLIKHKTANPQAVYLLGFYLPLAEIILLVLASQAIKKDEELVRSADRLR